MDLQLIKTLCANEKLRWTNHIFLRLVQRNISVEKFHTAMKWQNNLRKSLIV